MIELLSSRHLETLKSMRVSEVDTLVKDLYSLCKSNKHNNNQTKVVISDWIGRLSLNIITKVIAGKRYFGNDGNDEEAQHIGKIIKDFMYAAGVPVISDLIPFLKWIDLFGQVKFMKRVAKEFDSLVGSWVDEHTTRRVNGDEPSDKLDFIDVMLSKIEENSMFGHTRETIIKATATVRFCFIIHNLLICAIISYRHIFTLYSTYTQCLKSFFSPKYDIYVVIV